MRAININFHRVKKHTDVNSYRVNINDRLVTIVKEMDDITSRMSVYNDQYQSLVLDLKNATSDEFARVLIAINRNREEFDRLITDYDRLSQQWDIVIKLRNDVEK